MPVLKNPRHETFAQEIAKGRTADEAYQTAGYSENRGNATRLNANESIRKRVEEILSKAADMAQVTVYEVVAELKKLAFSNMADYYQADTTGPPSPDFSKLTREQWAAIGSIEVDRRFESGESAATVEKVKFKLYDKRAALNDLGRFLKMFTDKVEHTGADGGPMEFTFSLDRASKDDDGAGD
jgi:phage terminase small subunit